MSDLPNWVYDVVIELQRWADEHPNLYTSAGGVEGYFRTEKCGCEALERVPEDVRERAKVIAAYVSDADHQRARMGIPIYTGSDATGPWLHTCNLVNDGLTSERQTSCRACEAEKAGDL